MATRARDYHRERHLKYLSGKGLAGYVPAAPVRERLLSLRRRGVPLALIADRVGVSHHSLIAQMNGIDRRGVKIESCRYATHQSVMSARFTVDDIRSVDPVGVRRRLQALALAGYSMPFVADHLGFERRESWRLMSGARGKAFVTRATLLRVDAVYRKFEVASPESVGVDPGAASRTRILAARKGYVPRHCWDPDTIDDPEAFPEWTGCCGTARGSRIHAREGIPECEPCRLRVLVPSEGFQAAAFRALRLERGWSQPQLGERIGCSRESIAGWEGQRTNPRESVVPAILEAFGVERGALFKEE